MESDREKLRPILDRAGSRAMWVESGPGWWPILLKLDQDIAKLAPDYQVLQVKEKFGGLRYYIGGVPADVSDSVYALIDAAERESYQTCEECGEPGHERGGGWIKTLCDGCDAERQRRRAEREAMAKEALARLRGERE